MSVPPRPSAAQPEPQPDSAPGFSVVDVLEARREERWTWLASGALLVLLAWMLLMAGRADLAANAATRPFIERSCAVLGCQLPPWRDLDALHMVGHDVRAHPRQPGVLQVRAGFRNDAPWAQPWPRLLLVLSDAGGQTLAQRELAPNEYLHGPHPPLIGPGQTASIAFAVREPARDAVSFRFAFRPDGVAFSHPATPPR
ncbi:DUF3426 domain-containing protein [Luteimonas sp. e5]